jgi:3-deoxy-manno-octulosonate cytidylyltransferase (CMP-KDO synthetase)
MKSVAIIPARVKSSRFPNKILHNFDGKRIIDKVINNVNKLDFVDDIIIATDDIMLGKELKSIHSCVSDYHITDACCGTHRVFKYYEKNPGYDYYISIPSDEVALNPKEINKTISNIKIDYNEITSFYTKFYCKEDLHSCLSCKIVTTELDYMVYNSRTIVPVKKDGSIFNLDYYKKHVGIFIFPKEIFETYGESLWKHTTDIESLEQNRFLQRKVNIKMYETNHIGFGIDVKSQIKKLEERIKCQK